MTATDTAASRWALPAVVLDRPGGGRGRRDQVVDAAMLAFALAVGVATLIDSWESHPGWLRVVAVVVGLAGCAALRWRRTHPAEVGIALGVLSLGVLTLSGAFVAATFNAAVRASGRAVAVIAGLTVAWAVVNPLLYPPDIAYVLDAGASLLMGGVAFGWGLFVRARRELLRSLRAQADRAGDEARDAERRRIAREMHDVLAHRISLLSVHAGALEFRRDASPDEVAEAAGVIRENARAALDELRHVIGVLREGDTTASVAPPQPTIADIAVLVDDARSAGMRLTAKLALGDGSVSDAAGRTAYRIVQEGLTNARKHAPGAAVTLRVDARDELLRVEVRSLAPVAVPIGPPEERGTGTGLIGLAERVSLAGGQLEHGVDAEGAFVLRAKVPR